MNRRTFLSHLAALPAAFLAGKAAGRELAQGEPIYQSGLAASDMPSAPMVQVSHTSFTADYSAMETPGLHAAMRTARNNKFRASGAALDADTVLATGNHGTLHEAAAPSRHAHVRPDPL